MNGMIKDKDNSKAVNKQREDINSEKVEDNKSKAVKENNDVIKAAEEKPTFRDYSGKIHYGSSDKSTYNNKISHKGKTGFEKARKAKQAEKHKKSVVKSENSSDIIKSPNACNIVKEKDTSGIVKPADGTDIVKSDFNNARDTATAAETTVKATSSYKKVINKKRKEKSVGSNNIGNNRDIVKTDSTATVVKLESAAAVHNSENVADIIKSNSAANIVKPEIKSEIVKPVSDSIIKSKYNNTSNPRANDNVYKKAVNDRLKKQAVQKKETRSDNVNLSENRSGENLQALNKRPVIKPKEEISVIEHKSAKEDIISVSQEHALSSTSKDYINKTAGNTDNIQRSKLSKATRQKQLQKIKDRQKTGEVKQNETINISRPIVRQDDSSSSKQAEMVSSHTSSETAVYVYKDDEQQAKEQNAEMVKENSLPVKTYKETFVHCTETAGYTDNMQQSKLSKAIHREQQQTIKTGDVKQNEAINIDRPIVRQDDNSSSKQVEMVYSHTSSETAVYVYKDDEQQAREQNAEMVKENSLPVKTHKETAVHCTEETPKKKIENKRHSSQRKTAVSLGADNINNCIHSAVKNSEDETLQITEGAVSATATAYNIIEPKSTSPQKRLQRSNKAVKAASVPGIKSELKQNIVNVISDKNNSATELLRTGGTSVVKAIRSDISEKADEDMTFKAVDDVIKTGETATAVIDWYSAVSNSVKDIAYAGTSTAKIIKNAPYNIKTAYAKTKTTAKHFDAFRRLQTKQKIAVIKNKTASTVKMAAQESLKAAKSAALNVFALLFVNVIIIVAICGVVVGAIGSFIWQTPTDLDTTAIIKFIAEKDCSQQSKWYSKGFTNVNLEAKNDNTSDRSYECVYALAVDLPPDESVVNIGENSDGKEKKPTYTGFNKVFSSSDEMLETYRWTTDDYRAVLAYIQTRKENLGWFSTFFGFVGKMELEKAASELFEATYNHKIFVRDEDSDGNIDESYKDPIYSVTYSKDKANYYFYFGKKYSVKYLIDNDMIRFDDDDVKNNSMKEKFYNTYKYGNFAAANLSFPLELSDEETIESRISKHFGKQVVLTYKPPANADPDKTVYGSISKIEKNHYATDLSADGGDLIYAPISGLCKVVQREGRGFEYVISTAYNGNDFDFTKDGYLIKISCSSNSYVIGSKIVKQGDLIGVVAHNIGVNTTTPDSGNDTENEDIFAYNLFPCSTSTVYHEIGGDEFTVPEAEQDHIHIEMYKLPCDFSSKTDIEKNVLAPELFFDYSAEVE